MTSDQPDSVVESLRQERLNVQKKTFTKWANVHLQKYGLEIQDLFQDLGDGCKLMKLLESLTGEKLGKPAKGNSRIKKIENVSRCLMFLHSKKMRLENISSEDIVDGKPHLILGLLWTIILRCEISQNQPDNKQLETDVQPFSPQTRQPLPAQEIGKESLLLWCQTKTDGYPRVHVKDFKRSWRDGLAFNALIHSHVPALVDFNSLKQEEHIQNLDNAFSLASKHIGVPRLLDPEDVDIDNPDEKSIMIYVSTFCKGVGNIMKGMTGGKRIGNVLGKTMEIDKQKKSYSEAASGLLEWINAKVHDFASGDRLESLESIQQEIVTFKTYRTVEKPEQSEKKNEVEALFFSIQMQRLGRNGWIPPESVSPAAIEKAWSQLQRAEHEHEINIRNQLKEQERLENLAYKFETKRSVRESYIDEIQKILTDPNYGASIKQSDATFKKHEAIRTGILAREIMIKDLFKIAEILVESNYRRKDNIILWKNETEEKWSYLLRLLEAYDEKFLHLRQVISTLEEMDSILEEMQQLQAEMNAETEPLDIASSLQRHALKEIQVASWGEAVHRFEKKVEGNKEIKDTNLLQTQVKKLSQTYEKLDESCRIRREILEEQLKMKEHNENVEEIMAWIFENNLYCTSDMYCKDLPSTLLLKKKHKALESELKLQRELIDNIAEDRLKTAFYKLEDQWKEREKHIALAVEACQYICDADECTSWISENMHLLSTLDFGTDELTSEALHRRHTHVETKILAYAGEIKSLREVSEKICKSLSKLSESTEGGRKQKSYKISLNDIYKNSKLSAEYISNRQMEMESAYQDLQNQSQKRKLHLQHSSMYFNFKDRCDEVEKWMREKERIMDSNDFGDQAEEVEKRFEELITDMVAHGLILDELASIQTQLEEENADQAKTAKILLDDAKRRWHHLSELTRVKELNLKGFTSVLLAHRMCEENILWLNETNKSEIVDVIDDIKTFDDLRRRQEAIDREDIVVEDRVKQALVLAENVSNAYPDQRDVIQSRTRVLEDNWEQFQIKTKDRRKKIEKQAGLQIFKRNANALIEWSNAVERKLRMREKISDMGVAQSVVKDHDELGEEITIQEDRFVEIEELGLEVSQNHPEVKHLLKKMTESRGTVYELWHEKRDWLRQSLDLQVFDREANQLRSLCGSQNTLLEVAEFGESLSDVEILIRHHDSLMDTLKAQRNRFIAFNEMAENLLDSNHIENQYIRTRQEEIINLREGVLQMANERRLRLEQEFHLQEFNVDTQEMSTWIAEKNKLALDLLQCDNTTMLSSKIKRLETLEAELTSNENRLHNVYARGEKLSDEYTFAREELERVLEELENAWNLLCERLDLNRKYLYEEKELKDFYRSVEVVLNKQDCIKRSSETVIVENDPRGIKNILKTQETMENDQEKLTGKVSELIKQGQKLTKDTDCDKTYIQNLISEMEQKLEATKQPLVARRDKLETCLKFHQFKAELERELTWISDQIILLSTDSLCQNLLEAQKQQKKIENLEVTLECHQKIVGNLSTEMLVLVAEKECSVDITKTCEHMEEEWNKLLGIFYDKKAKTSFTLKAQMFYSEANEIDAWISEKKQVLSSADYGKDEHMVIKLLTKQKDTELEIDSYKGLVEELSNQAESLIELNNSDSKIVKNRMEIIDQDMKHIQSQCSTRRQKLIESKSQREFEKETEELGTWINEQMSQAKSEDYGEDYEHILILNTNFEFFRARVEAGSKRIMQYEDFAKRLINSKCPFIENVNESLELLSSRWTELLECLEARAFKLEAAADIHRYHRDVTDILARVHSYYQALPNDLGSSLAQAQQLAKKHDSTENELLGIEAQVHLLLEDSTRLQDTYPGGNEEHIQMQLSLVIENWNLLQQKVATRKANLIASQRIHKFLSLVREEENWSKQICFELESDNVPRDVEQITNQHHITEVEIETRLSNYESFHNDGESLLVYNIFRNQINEKLEVLSEIQKRVEKAWSVRCNLIRRTKAVILFFNDAKQIQTSIATREVQLCGTETKEIVEDLESALKKHSEFQKTMDIQEEKFKIWEEQGKNLLKQNVPESERIQKKLEDLSSRRQRLLNFSAERCETFSKSLRLAKFKRDTIEVETWIKEKKNKVKMIIKDYSQLNTEEKIKCLQKQQAIQAEIEAHECIIQRIIQQKKKIPQVGEALNVRVELILENWNEIKGNADRMGRDLKEAQDMLIIHDYFEKADSWIKEKELLIQKNDSGKDYEHCVALQIKLDDNNSSTKVDATFMKNMRELAEKLSRKENQNGVYIRYERINEKWNYLQEEIALYRRKLNGAVEVHAFIKDLDDTIDRIREKSIFLSAREEVQELSAAEMVRRKFEAVEKDLTAIDKKLKEQCISGEILAEHHELSAGRIHDKINQVKREWHELQKELERKKNHVNAVHISLKFVKDAEDMEKIVNDIITEMEYGEIPSDSADAISFLQAHNNYKAQITSCQDKIKNLEDYGGTVLRTPGVLVEEVGNSRKYLSQMSKSIQMSWDYRLNLLTQHRDIQIFTEKAKQIQTWFASKEAFLANKDVGDSMSSVEALIRKHENFEKSCHAYFEKLQELEILASELRNYEDCKEIENWYENLCLRRDRLLMASEERKQVLMESKSLQQLLLDIYEVTNWMNEKIQVVSEEPYRDLTNILSKTQKHATLEAEILSNHSRIVAITSQADEMLGNSHFASEEIRQHVQNLEDMWQKLMDLTNEQKMKLNDAYNALKFKQKQEDINNWIDETENQLEFENYVTDVVSIQHEIDKLQSIEKDIEGTEKTLRILSEASEKFDHSSKEEILSAFRSTENRFRNVEDLVVMKFAKLQDDLSLAGLEKDINDEMSWIEDNIAVCQSEEYFDDVVSVQVLQKKLQALETEMISREPLISSIVERGTRMNNTTAEIKVKHLKNRYQELKDSISLRRLRLSDALEAQTYYFEVTQAELWIKEKMAQVSSCDSDIDMYTVQEIKKKMNTIEATVNGFKQNIISLEELSSSLVRRGHYDDHNIRLKQEELNMKYEQLTCSVLKKIAVLREQEEYFSYQRDANSVMSQLKSMNNATASTDVGRDVEHVESLIQKLQLYRNKLCTHEATVKNLQQRAMQLIDGGHTESEKIKQLLTDLEDTWLECDYSAGDRYKRLEQAKMIHSFNKSADETISWIYEKDVALLSENFGHDLQSIQTLLRHHETLEGDLKAIQEQVEALNDEATTLSNQFPDSDDALQEKYSAVTEAWNRCTENAINRKEKLLQAEQMQSYFDEARDFHAWIREMSALITREDLPEDVSACEALIAQNDGYKSDIDDQKKSFRQFESRGQEIIGSGHFMANEIEEKLKNLNISFDELFCLWQERRQTHEQNLDLQLFKKKLKELDTWLQGQEHCLSGEDGRSLEEVEYLIRKHEQFEQKLNLYEAKFQELVKTTKIEEEILRRKEEENQKKSEQEKMLEQRKVEEIKKKEEERILEERRKERAETEITHKVESDDDFLPYDDLPVKEQVFKRIGSRISFPDQTLELSRPQTPVIMRKKFSVSKTVVAPTTAEGFLNRKQEILNGGKRSNVRGWKNFYTVLCGQLLCFFKDKKSFLEQNAAKYPVNILGARCSIPKDYHKKKFVFRLEPTDNSSFLFEALNDIKRNEWMQKIQFTASLHPSMQLMNASEGYVAERDTKANYSKQRPASTACTESYSKARSPSITSEERYYKAYSLSITSEDYCPKAFSASNASEELCSKAHSASNVSEDFYAKAHSESNASEDFYSKAHSASISFKEYDDLQPNEEPLYHDVIDGVDNVSNPMYAIPRELNDRTSTATSYDETLHSARSSFSNQSSYRTALASTSSVSTLQDEHTESSEEDFIYSLPEPLTRTKSEVSMDPTHEKVTKVTSLPREVSSREPKAKKESKSRWKAFSLRRRK